MKHRKQLLIPTAVFAILVGCGPNKISTHGSSDDYGERNYTK